MDTKTKSGFIAIVGKPNVGKSSLLNALVGEKVAIVSGKPQTTRTRITGVLTEGEVQLVFIDTPGLHKAKNKLSEYMVEQVKDSVADVDLAVLVADATAKEIYKAERELMESFAALHLPAILVLNKIDLLDKKDALMARMQAFSQCYDFAHILPLSAQTGEGVDELLQILREAAEEGPHFFPDDALTDQPERVIVAEIIREKILNHMYEEIPHGTAVAIESMKERPGGKLMDIHATILCEKQSHKGMVIGKNGAMLKTVASEARAEIESFLDCKVNLQCWVKVRDDWRNKERVIKELGYQ
ncbi:GTPase Era [Zongyangia hominis]|uniref:GTPase Era n=1 Tax=Zongyangia hominis TaxID=2763677 RepID=A0A926EFG0_9FIRM|nr:GTPase Era [Zongyangia hominis]MBC8570866.1 GTPase Era [Zongyangia hominis]